MAQHSAHNILGEPRVSGDVGIRGRAGQRDGRPEVKLVQNVKDGNVMLQLVMGKISISKFHSAKDLG